MAKLKQGQILIGAIGIGVVDIDLELDDGSNWNFKGLAVPGFICTGSVPLSAGDFPGIDHMQGACTFQIAAASAGIIPVGGAILHFNDTHGNIGFVGTMTLGVGIVAGGGGGEWTKQ